MTKTMKIIIRESVPRLKRNHMKSILMLRNERFLTIYLDNFDAVIVNKFTVTKSSRYKKQNKKLPDSLKLKSVHFLPQDFSHSCSEIKVIMLIG